MKISERLEALSERCSERGDGVAQAVYYAANLLAQILEERLPEPGKCGALVLHPDALGVWLPCVLLKGHTDKCTLEEAT